MALPKIIGMTAMTVKNSAPASVNAAHGAMEIIAGGLAGAHAGM